MSLETPQLHERFLAPLGAGVVRTSDLSTKPLEVDLQPPHPPLLRIYLYNLIGGLGTKRDTEYKATLRVPGQRVGEYGSFSHAGGRSALLVAYRAEIDVFVLWDASLHPRFKNGGNIQVKTTTVLEAAASGFSSQTRRLTTKKTELVFACQSSTLAETIARRILMTGGVSDADVPR